MKMVIGLGFLPNDVDITSATPGVVITKDPEDSYPIPMGLIDEDNMELIRDKLVALIDGFIEGITEELENNADV